MSDDVFVPHKAPIRARAPLTDENANAEVVGIAVDIKFRDRPDGWSPGRVQLPDGKTIVAAVGKWYGALKGTRVKLTGTWNTHPQWGKQFAFHAIETVEAENATEEIKLFLEHRMPGIGVYRAKLILDTFGEDATRVIEDDPQTLARKISGISERMALEIQSAYRFYKDELATAKALRKWKLEPHIQAKVVRRWVKDAVAKLEEDPFNLYYHIDGASFDMADRARSIVGIGDKDPRRLRAAMVYAIQDKAESEGSTCLGETDCLNFVSMKLGCSLTDAVTALDSAVAGGYVVKAKMGRDTVVFRTPVALQEQLIADQLLSMLGTGPCEDSEEDESDPSDESEPPFDSTWHEDASAEECPTNGLLCSVCLQPQHDTPSGSSCAQGHGGAEGITPLYQCHKCGFETEHKLLTMRPCCGITVCQNCFDRHGSLRLVQGGGFGARCPGCNVWLRIAIGEDTPKILGLVQPHEFQVKAAPP